MLIWGSKGRTKTVSSGEFYCPRCGERRAYELKEIGKYFTLYFIPIVKTKDLAEYVECQTCGAPFDPEIIQSSRQLEADQQTSDQIADFVASAREVLNNGIPLDVLIAEFQRNGLDKEAAIKLVMMAAGNSISKCPTCDMDYSGTLSFCSGCGTRLLPLSP